MRALDFSNCGVSRLVGNRDNGSALLRFSGLSRAQHLKQARINHQMIRFFQSKQRDLQGFPQHGSLCDSLAPWPAIIRQGWYTGPNEFFTESPTRSSGLSSSIPTIPTPHLQPWFLCPQRLPSRKRTGRSSRLPSRQRTGRSSIRLPMQSQLFKTMLSYCFEPLNLITTNNSIYKQTLQTPNNS